MPGFDEVIQPCEVHATLPRVAREWCASFRTAALILAIGRVGRATTLRGL